MTAFLRKYGADSGAPCEEAVYYFDIARELDHPPSVR